MHVTVQLTIAYLAGNIKFISLYIATQVYLFEIVMYLLNPTMSRISLILHAAEAKCLYQRYPTNAGGV